MERHEEISPETIPYWNYIKDASPKVKSELGYMLIHVHPNDNDKVEEMEKAFSAHDVSERETDAFLAEFAGKWPFEGIEPEEFTKICEGNRSDNRPIAAFNE